MIYPIPMAFSTSNLRVFFVMLVLGSSCGGPPISSEVCNPLACLHHYNSFFVVGEEDYDPCKKFRNLKLCTSPCLKQSVVSAEMIMKNLESVENSICGVDMWETINQMDLQKDRCPSKKKYRFLSCLYEAWNLDHNNQLGDQNILTCKKLMTAESCLGSMDDCSMASQEFIEDLLLKFTQSLKEEYCDGYSVGEVWSYSTKSLLSSHEVYNPMSKCFDVHQKEIMSCIPDKWTANFIVTQYKMKEMCGAYENFLSCTKDVLTNKCDKAISKLFLELGKKVGETFLPHCLEKDVYVDNASSTTYPLNIAQKDSIVHAVVPVTDSASPKYVTGKERLSSDEKVLKAEYGNASTAVSDIIIIHFGPLSLDGASHLQSSIFVSLGFLIWITLNFFSPSL